MDTLAVQVCDVALHPDPRRVITRPFVSGAYLAPEDRLVERILALTDGEVTATLSSAYERYEDRHRDLEAVLEEHFSFVAKGWDHGLETLTGDRRQLIGAYYTQEFAVEAAALTNPSMVPAPDQSGVPAGAQRVVLSLRAIGEGHLSSIEFRIGLIDASGHATIEAPSRFALTGSHDPAVLDRKEFRSKLAEMKVYDDLAVSLVDQLPSKFQLEHLETVIAAEEGTRTVVRVDNPTARAMHWLAKSNYHLTFPTTSLLSERVIFPWTSVESRGLEDARFVRFVDDDGSVTYYATYTAYDGFRVLPQLIATEDFLTFDVGTLGGSCAANKGAALFPRRIGGRYAALSRYDAENSWVMFSDRLQVWDTAERIDVPAAPWDLARVGNCGSPLETDQGWLVITHGVGPFREYCLGALLLDLDDPRRVIGRLDRPLLTPKETDRDGYVPNVVYSCGSLIHGDTLLLPFGTADTACRVARIELDSLLRRLTGSDRVPAPT